jgi:hypothetical protein
MRTRSTYLSLTQYANFPSAFRVLYLLCRAIRGERRGKLNTKNKHEGERNLVRILIPAINEDIFPSKGLIGHGL